MSEKKSEQKKLVTIIYHKSNVITFQLDPKQDLVKITGGTNHIPADIFELMKKDSILNGKIESGMIEVISEDAKSGNPSDAYKSLKPKARRDVLSNETSVDLLKSYLEVETNIDLKKLIEEKITQLDAPVQFRE